MRVPDLQTMDFATGLDLVNRIRNMDRYEGKGGTGGGKGNGTFCLYEIYKKNFLVCYSRGIR